MAYDRADWSKHYDDGKGFRPLRDAERDLFARHAPAPEGGRALEVGCGTGELAARLAGLGYDVDALDFAEAAVARARKEHESVDGVRWLCLDIEHDDPADLHDEGYDLITMRLVYAFVGDRSRVVRSLADRLRPGGRSTTSKVLGNARRTRGSSLTLRAVAEPSPVHIHTASPSHENHRGT